MDNHGLLQKVYTSMLECVNEQFDKDTAARDVFKAAKYYEHCI